MSSKYDKLQLEEPGFRQMPIIFRAQIFTRHKTWQLVYYSA